MDGGSFDALARNLARIASRRRLVGGAVAGLFGVGVAGAMADDAAALGERTCRKSGVGCTRTSQCCAGECATGKDRPRSQRNRCVCQPTCAGRQCGDNDCGGVCGPAAGECVSSWDTCEDHQCVNACTPYNTVCYMRADGTVAGNPTDCWSSFQTGESCTVDDDCKTGYEWNRLKDVADIRTTCHKHLFVGGSFVVTQVNNTCIIHLEADAAACPSLS